MSLSGSDCIGTAVSKQGGASRPDTQTAGFSDLDSQAVVGDGKAPVTERSGLFLELNVTHPRVPHVSEKDAGETG